MHVQLFSSPSADGKELEPSKCLPSSSPQLYSSVLSHRKYTHYIPPKKIERLIGVYDMLLGKVAGVHEKHSNISSIPCHAKSDILNRYRCEVKDSKALGTLSLTIDQVQRTWKEIQQSYYNLLAYLTFYLELLNQVRTDAGLIPIWRFGLDHRLSEIETLLRLWKRRLDGASILIDAPSAPVEQDKEQIAPGNEWTKQEKELALRIKEALIAPSFIPSELKAGLIILQNYVKLKETLNFLIKKKSHLKYQKLESRILDEQCLADYQTCLSAFTELQDTKGAYFSSSQNPDKKEWALAYRELHERIEHRAKEVEEFLVKIKVPQETENQLSADASLAKIASESVEASKEQAAEEQYRVDQCFQFLEEVVSLKETIKWFCHFESEINSEDRKACYLHFKKAHETITAKLQSFEETQKSICEALNTKIQSSSEEIKFIEEMDQRVHEIFLQAQAKGFPALSSEEKAQAHHDSSSASWLGGWVWGTKS